mmetsp:Transcript_100359/g.288321  ORF Transcript_100359/g.288321 Transcript_100359/m.288321 type:complete len:236 (+) Transcript_100359:434-1141(+)
MKTTTAAGSAATSTSRTRTGLQQFAARRPRTRTQMKTRTTRSVRRPAPPAASSPAVARCRFRSPRRLGSFVAPALRSHDETSPRRLLGPRAREFPWQPGVPLPWQLLSLSEPRSSPPRLGRLPWVGQPELPSAIMVTSVQLLEGRRGELDCGQISRISLLANRSSTGCGRHSDARTRSSCCRGWVRGGISRRPRCPGKPSTDLLVQRSSCQTQTFVPCTMAPTRLTMRPSSGKGC